MLFQSTEEKLKRKFKKYFKGWYPVISLSCLRAAKIGRLYWILWNDVLIQSVEIAILKDIVVPR